MKFFIFKTIFFAALLSFNLFAYEQGKKYDLTFLHISDTHGEFTSGGSADDGGFPILSTILKEIRQKADQNNEAVFLTSSGDINTGNPYSDFLNARPDFFSMNYLKFDAMALGNHEFDNSKETINKQQEWAGFPFLCANLETQNLNVLPYTIIQKNGLKVAFLGLITQDMPLLVPTENLVGIKFLNIVDTAQKWVPFLKKNADIVVALTHIGFDPLATSIDDQHLAKMVSGIDLILGGHSHSLFKEVVTIGKTIIMHAGAKNKFLAKIDLSFLNKELSLKSASLLPITGPKDQTLSELLKPFLIQVDEILKKVIGESKITISIEPEQNINYATTAGTLTTRAIRESTNADLAIYNTGGIRNSIEKGPITYADILKMHPFRNTICTVDLTGEELFNYLQHAIKLNLYPQANALFLKINPQTKQILDILIKTKNIDLKKIYKVALNSFMASGGDGFLNLKNHPSFKDLQIKTDSAVQEYILKKKIITNEDIKPYNYYIYSDDNLLN